MPGEYRFRNNVSLRLQACTRRVSRAAIEPLSTLEKSETLIRSKVQHDSLCVNKQITREAGKLDFIRGSDIYRAKIEKRAGVGGLKSERDRGEKHQRHGGVFNELLSRHRSQESSMQRDRRAKRLWLRRTGHARFARPDAVIKQ